MLLTAYERNLSHSHSPSISPSSRDHGRNAKTPSLVVIGLAVLNISHFRFSAPVRQLALSKLASVSHDQFSFQHVSAST